MHVLIDLRWMIPGYTGGIESMSRSFVDTLLRANSRDEYTLLLPLATRYDFDLRGRRNFHLLVSDGPASYIDAWRWRSVKKRADREGRTLPGVWVNGRRIDAQIAISISGVVHRDLSALKNLLILTDVQHDDHPELFSPHELQQRTRDLDAALCVASRVITISEFSRRALLGGHAYPAGQTQVAYLAADPIFALAPSLPHKTWEKYGLAPHSYLFYPAHTWPHKNHGLILQALAILKNQPGPTLSLVCTGAPKEAHASLLSQANTLGVSEQIRFLGYCPHQEMPALYRGAAALVFPSLYEGFGMPILEAMWSDCPVICSNTTSLPEVAGEAALFFDPSDPLDLANAIQRLLSNPSLRSELVEKGHEQARCFSWEKFTEIVLENLERLDVGAGVGAGLRPAPTPTHPSPTPISRTRTSHSRDRIHQGLEQARQGKPFHAAARLFSAALIGPDVFFNLILFPFFRDRILRPILKRVILPPDPIEYRDD